MKQISIFTFSTTLFAFCNACCSVPEVITNYRLKSNLPLPAWKTSDATLYPNLFRYGVNCGHNKYWNLTTGSAIIGGVNAFENEFTYQAVVSYGGLFCSGTIVNQLSHSSVKNFVQLINSFFLSFL